MWLISNKVKVGESGMLEGFRDCHSHLLPSVDDGVKKAEETLKILRLWETMGMSDVWLTPHIMEDIPNLPEALTQLFDTIKRKYVGQVHLHLAAENMMDNLFIERISEGVLMPIGESRAHLLVETSYYNPPIGMERTIELVKQQGLTPILAHPERYQYMDIGDYKKWKQRGVRLQLNVPSLVGAYGPEVQKKAEMLLGKGLYDYCGTDTHSLRFAEYFLNSKISKKNVKEIQRIAKEQEL